MWSGWSLGQREGEKQGSDHAEQGRPCQKFSLTLRSVAGVKGREECGLGGFNRDDMFRFVLSTTLPEAGRTYGLGEK